MNYNDYDSNGNKKGFNLDLSDKKTKARVILVVYLLLFVVLVVVIRTSGFADNSDTKTTANNTSANTNTVIDNTTPKINTEEDFSLIDENNYEFIITLNYEDKSFVSDTSVTAKFDSQ